MKRAIDGILAKRIDSYSIEMVCRRLCLWSGQR